MAHAVKASTLLSQPTDWAAPAANSVSNGVKIAHDASFKFQDYLVGSGPLHLLEVANVSTEFSQSAFLSFLLLLRAPSEKLLARMATRRVA